MRKQRSDTGTQRVDRGQRVTYTVALYEDTHGDLIRAIESTIGTQDQTTGKFLDKQSILLRALENLFGQEQGSVTVPVGLNEQLGEIQNMLAQLLESGVKPSTKSRKEPQPKISTGYLANIQKAIRGDTKD